MAALLCAIAAGLMLVPNGASTGAMMTVVQDSTGDIGFGVDPKTGLIMQTWEDNTPVSKAGYFDMASTWLSQKGKTYTFWMELAAELPKEGSPSPTGIHLAEWAVWIDPSPYNCVTNTVASLFLIALRYDGASYAAFVVDYSTMTTTPIPFSVDGSKLQLQFSAASIGGLAFEWWSPLVRAWWGQLGTSGYWFVDAVDLGSATGQEYMDIPWPPP